MYTQIYAWKKREKRKKRKKQGRKPFKNVCSPRYKWKKKRLNLITWHRHSEQSAPAQNHRPKPGRHCGGDWLGEWGDWLFHSVISAPFNLWLRLITNIPNRPVTTETTACRALATTDWRDGDDCGGGDDGDDNGEDNDAAALLLKI